MRNTGALISAQTCGWLGLLLLSIWSFSASAQDYPQANDTAGEQLFAQAAQDSFSFWIPDPTPGYSAVASDDETPAETASAPTDQGVASTPVDTYDSGPIVYGYINGVYVPYPYAYSPYSRHHDRDGDQGYHGGYYPNGSTYPRTSSQNSGNTHSGGYQGNQNVTPRNGSYQNAPARGAVYVGPATTPAQQPASQSQR